MSSSTSGSDVGATLAARANQPRLFVVSSLATIAVGLAALWVMTATLRQGFLPGEYAVWASKRQIIAGCPSFATVVLGDSRAAAAFVPSRIPDSVNYALGGATPIELFYTAERILACPQAPRRVLLSISMPQLTRAAYFWQRSALFGFLSFAELEQVRRRSRALGDQTVFAAPTIGDVDAILTNWLYAHQFPSFYAAYLVNEAVVARLQSNQRIGSEIARSGGQHLYGSDPGSDGVSDDGLDREFRAAPILDDYLRRMVALFAARGTELDFVGVPMNDATYRSVTPAAARGFRDYIASLAKSFPGFHVAGDPLPHWNDRWFGDSAHLNAAGADRFSERVAEYGADRQASN